jgi:hypothetical protein
MSKLAAMALWAALTTAQIARASDVDLRWDAPASCPALEALRSGLSQRLGRAVVLGVDAATQVAGVVTLRGDGYAMALRTRAAGGEDERLLQARGCNELARAAVLATALLLTEGTSERDHEREREHGRAPESDHDHDHDRAAEGERESGHDHDHDHDHDARRRRSLTLHAHAHAHGREGSEGSERSERENDHDHDHDHDEKEIAHAPRSTLTGERGARAGREGEVGHFRCATGLARASAWVARAGGWVMRCRRRRC